MVPDRDGRCPRGAALVMLLLMSMTFPVVHGHATEGRPHIEAQHGAHGVTIPASGDQRPGDMSPDCFPAVTLTVGWTSPLPEWSPILAPASAPLRTTGSDPPAGRGPRAPPLHPA